jgi:heme exporter protein B
VFLGKAAAIAVELAVVQIVLWLAMTVLFGVRIHSAWIAIVGSVLATLGLASAGALYGALCSGLRVRETLLPLLVLPVLAPVLLAASRTWSAALSGTVSSGVGWLRVLGPFAAVYLVMGVVLYGPLMETG